MTRWDHRRYGSASDPIRQSDLADIASAYGCSKRFQMRKQAEAEGRLEVRETISGRMANGTAIHETIRAYLDDCRAWPRIQQGELPSPEAVAQVYARELVTAAEGKRIEWYGDDLTQIGLDAVAMVRGALRATAERAADIVACEAPFLVELDEYWLQGTIDLVYRPKSAPDAIAFLDWKTGEQRIAQIILDHGYQTAIYSHAIADGVLFPGTPRASSPKMFPAEIHVVHLRDFVPYKKATTKTVERPEECAHFGVSRGTKVKLVAGDTRGPGFYRAHRKPEDVARLRVSIRNIVSTVRLGRFVEFLDEHCDRCPFKSACLTDGHAVAGDEKKQLEAALRGVDFDADEVAA